MSSLRKYVVWVWFDVDAKARFVGWGRMGQSHPAKKLWAQRQGEDSDLNIWLRTFSSEPNRKDYTSAVQMYRHEASATSQALRKKYKAEGCDMVDPRPHGTKEGGGAARMVMSPDLTVFGSVRQAAVDEGVNPCTITRWCQTDGTGWDYLN